MSSEHDGRGAFETFRCKKNKKKDKSRRQTTVNIKPVKHDVWLHYKLHFIVTEVDTVNGQQLFDTHSIIAAENVDGSADGDLASSFSCLRRIFPAAERGISDRNSTPPRSLLYATT